MGSKPDLKLNAKANHYTSNSKLVTSTQESVAIQRLGDVQALKPKASEFPLDHFFPVFSRKEVKEESKKDVHARKASMDEQISISA